MVQIDQIREFMGFSRNNIPMTINCDNMSAIELCKTLKTTSKTRHINRDINYIRECINLSIIQIIFMPTDFNVADILTKPLPQKSFEQHKHRLLYGFENDSDFIKSSINYTEAVHLIEQFEEENNSTIF